MGLFITVTYSGDFSGEEGLVETDHETTGELFRALTGRDPQRPWESLGRCIGKSYIDGDGPCTLCGEPDRSYHLHAVTADECNAVVIGGTTGHCKAPRDHHRYQASSVQVGWVFEARDPDGEKGRREAWVSVYTAPPTITRIDHRATF